MARTSLAERQTRLERQRARLQLEESALKEAARKARTRRLIEAGGLVEKAGLLDLDSAVLYGALLQIGVEAAKPERCELWRVAGGRAFDREAKAKAAGREPLVLSLTSAPTAPVQAQLRKAGFRWSKVLRHWEGMALLGEAQAIVDQYGGSVRRVGSSEDSTEPAPTAPGAPIDASAAAGDA